MSVRAAAERRELRAEAGMRPLMRCNETVQRPVMRPAETNGGPGDTSQSRHTAPQSHFVTQSLTSQPA